MKKVMSVFAAVTISLLIASISFAQMQNKPGQADMMADMSSIMNDMSGMMVKMSGMMKDMNPEKMKMMSGIMKDLSQEMTDLSSMMSSNMMTDRELEKTHVRLQKMQQQMSSLEMKK